MNGMSWLWLALIAGGAGYGGYVWGVDAAKKAKAVKAGTKALKSDPAQMSDNELAASIASVSVLASMPGASQANKDRLAELQAEKASRGSDVGWVGSPRYFGSGTAGPRPDFVMGQQLQAGGGMFAPISGGSIGY